MLPSLKTLGSELLPSAGYCSYPGVEPDPMLAEIRSRAGFEEVRVLARQCREQFLAERNQ